MPGFFSKFGSLLLSGLLYSLTTFGSSSPARADGFELKAGYAEAGRHNDYLRVNNLTTRFERNAGNPSRVGAGLVDTGRIGKISARIAVDGTFDKQNFSESTVERLNSAGPVELPNGSGYESRSESQTSSTSTFSKLEELDGSLDLCWRARKPFSLEFYLGTQSQEGRHSSALSSRNESELESITSQTEAGLTISTVSNTRTIVESSTESKTRSSALSSGLKTLASVQLGNFGFGLGAGITYRDTKIKTDLEGRVRTTSNGSAQVYVGNWVYDEQLQPFDSTKLTKSHTEDRQRELIGEIPVQLSFERPALYVLAQLNTAFGLKNSRADDVNATLDALARGADGLLGLRLDRDSDGHDLELVVSTDDSERFYTAQRAISQERARQFNSFIAQPMAAVLLETLALDALRALDGAVASYLVRFGRDGQTVHAGTAGYRIRRTGTAVALGYNGIDKSAVMTFDQAIGDRHNVTFRFVNSPAKGDGKNSELAGAIWYSVRF